MIHGIQWVRQETFFKIYPAQEGPPSALFENSKNLASSSRGLRSGNTGNTLKHGERVRREPQSSAIPTPRLSMNYETWEPLSRTGETYSQNCTMEAPRHSRSEWHYGKFQDSNDFHCWRIIFRTEVCASTPFLQLTM